MGDQEELYRTRESAFSTHRFAVSQAFLDDQLLTQKKQMQTKLELITLERKTERLKKKMKKDRKKKKKEKKKEKRKVEEEG